MTDKKQHVIIAKTILEQIETLDVLALMSWNAKDFIAIPEGEYKPAAKMKGLTKRILGGLHFRVSGRAFKGHIYITLNTSDEYDIQAVTPFKTNRQTFATSGGKLKKVVSGVYVDNLIGVLDDVVHGYE